MIAIPWAKVHGASTHFPVALTVVAFACDFAAVVLWSRPAARGLRSTGAYAMMLAALGSVGAVVSGLVMTHGELWGSGDLGWHHRLVWPAFALIIAAATWRLLVGENLGRRSYARYLMVVMGATALMGAAAYFGGEMLQGAVG